VCLMIKRTGAHQFRRVMGGRARPSCHEEGLRITYGRGTSIARG
jgi:hypothetical protein